MWLPRVRFTVRRMMALVAVVSVVFALCCIPITTWSGAKRITLTVRVVDGGAGRPIPGAEVELIDPFDDERPPVKGRTNAVGCIVLQNQFRAYGVDFLVWGSEHVTFSPFVVRVTGDGYSEVRVPLARRLLHEGKDIPGYALKENATAPPLNLTYPVKGPVTITLTRSPGEARGRMQEP